MFIKKQEPIEVEEVEDDQNFGEAVTPFKEDLGDHHFDYNDLEELDFN